MHGILISRSAMCWICSHIQAATDFMSDTRRGYTATDIVCRMKRMQGHNVLHPMGWDAFGLPAEQFAITTGNHPAQFTKMNIDHFREQIRALGFSYDWDREISTTDPNYYKWTQWIFLKLYDKGLAYVDEILSTGVRSLVPYLPMRK